VNIRINLESEGLESIFKPYQVKIMEYLWGSDKPKRSYDVWQGVGPENISRASIINSLKWLRDLRFIKETTETGKGGHRGLYEAFLTEQEILVEVYDETRKKLSQEKN